MRTKTFDLKVVTDHLEKAMSSLPAEAPCEVDGEVCLKDIVNYFKTAIGTCQLIGTELREKLVSIRDKLVSVRDRVNKANEHVRFSREEQKSLKGFCAGITHFRKTLVIILGIPPMKLWYALLMRANKPVTAVQSSTYFFFSWCIFHVCALAGYRCLLASLLRPNPLSVL